MSRHYDPKRKHQYIKGRHGLGGVTHFAHRPHDHHRKRRVAMKVIGTDIGSLVDASSPEQTDEFMRRLIEAGEVLKKAIAGIAARFSRRIPLSLEVKHDTHSVYILGGGRRAPNAYPFDPPTNPPVYHPVWGYGPRSKWHWAPQPYRPFMEEGTDLAGDKAADTFAQIIDDWAKEIGTDRP